MTPRVPPHFVRLYICRSEIEILDIPAWDCQPYDRISPHAAIVARRMTTLSRLTRAKSSAERPRVITTTIDCILQRTPPRELIAAETFSAAPGNVVKLDELALWLRNKWLFTGKYVHETGEYAQRGGLIDLFPSGAPSPIRLDFLATHSNPFAALTPKLNAQSGNYMHLI